MSAANTSLKFHLERLTRVFHRAEKLNENDSLELDALSARTVLQTLRVLTKQAGNLELELSLLRDSEAGKLLASTAEAMATGELAGMLDKAHSNVIRPDFGGKTK